MPFGCLTIGEKKDYHNPSDVTDKYDLGQIVKSEEFCEIFRAKDKTTMKMYTCKKFLKKDGRKVRKAAKNEILILKMVKHPNILQLVDVYETKKEYFLFLELATGREVFDWILDQGYYSERDTSNVVRQVLEAVAYLHSLQIVHRNLKLENLVYYNRLKHSKIVISDFHLAKLENGLIKDPCGTPEYLAPEVVGRQRYGRPVDCWAIGVIMYILLSGNPPFYDETDDDDYENHDKNLFRKILAGDYEFDSPYWDEISDSAKTLVARLMEVDQDQRLTAQEAINHEWISGGAASDKNIKENVCAQIEKNFARAKWKVRLFVLYTLQPPPQQTLQLPRLLLTPLHLCLLLPPLRGAPLWSQGSPPGWRKASRCQRPRTGQQPPTHSSRAQRSRRPRPHCVLLRPRMSRVKPPPPHPPSV
uniref:CaM kinase-like vesicle-associated protein n=1 Tax=Anabas testudineus TaxID=64144 RepID=A0A3Q1I7U7_ANATE